MHRIQTKRKEQNAATYSLPFSPCYVFLDLWFCDRWKRHNIFISSGCNQRMPQITKHAVYIPSTLMLSQSLSNYLYFVKRKIERRKKITSDVQRKKGSMLSSNITPLFLHPRGRGLGREGSLVVTVCSAHLRSRPDKSIGIQCRWYLVLFLCV